MFNTRWRIKRIDQSYYVQHKYWWWPFWITAEKDMGWCAISLAFVSQRQALNYIANQRIPVNTEITYV